MRNEVWQTDNRRWSFMFRHKMHTLYTTTRERQGSWQIICTFCTHTGRIGKRKNNCSHVSNMRNANKFILWLSNFCYLREKKNLKHYSSYHQVSKRTNASFAIASLYPGLRHSVRNVISRKVNNKYCPKALNFQKQNLYLPVLWVAKELKNKFIFLSLASKPGLNQWIHERIHLCSYSYMGLRTKLSSKQIQMLACCLKNMHTDLDC